MNVLKKMNNKMEVYRNKDYGLPDVVIAGQIGIIIGILCMYPLIL